MNSYVLASEIQSFVHLGYSLRPDLVISHTGWNDAIYGLFVTENFQKLGLNYNIWLEEWVKILYGNSKGEISKISLLKSMRDNFDPKRIDEIPKAFWRQVSKYKDIVSASGGDFVVGIQPYNRTIENNSMATIYKTVHQVYSKMTNSIGSGFFVEDFSKDSRYKFVDSIHTTEASAEAVAGVYDDLIASKNLLNN